MLSFSCTAVAILNTVCILNRLFYIIRFFFLAGACPNGLNYYCPEVEFSGRLADYAFIKAETPRCREAWRDLDNNNSLASAERLTPDQEDKSELGKLTKDPLVRSSTKGIDVMRDYSVSVPRSPSLASISRERAFRKTNLEELAWLSDSSVSVPRSLSLVSSTSKDGGFRKTNLDIEYNSNSSRKLSGCSFLRNI